MLWDLRKAGNQHQFVMANRSLGANFYFFLNQFSMTFHCCWDAATMVVEIYVYSLRVVFLLPPPLSLPCVDLKNAPKSPTATPRHYFTQQLYAFRPKTFPNLF
jgi:hypothetical protein